MGHFMGMYISYSLDDILHYLSDLGDFLARRRRIDGGEVRKISL